LIGSKIKWPPARPEKVAVMPNGIKYLKIIKRKIGEMRQELNTYKMNYK